MNNEPNQANYLAGDFISETAVRGVFAWRRRPTQPTASAEPVHGLTADTPTAVQDSSSPSAGRPLRRWSVADLIARAGVAPPRTA